MNSNGNNKGTSTIKEITLSLVYAVRYFVQINMRYFATIIAIVLPYAMYVIGQHVALDRGKFAIGSEVFIPVLVTIVVHYLREVANRNNKGTRIPVPRKRFTEVSDDGEVTVERNRLQELLLYVADLEDWLHSKGML